MFRQNLILFVLALHIVSSFGGVPHTHNHKGSGGERASDGAFSPRDHEHMVDGDHDSAFDHEAILGELIFIFKRMIYLCWDDDLMFF